MSQFDGYKTALDGAVFNFYGDPASITAGPLKPERGTSPETVATLDYDDVRDDMNALIATSRRTRRTPCANDGGYGAYGSGPRQALCGQGGGA